MKDILGEYMGKVQVLETRRLMKGYDADLEFQIIVLFKSNIQYANGKYSLLFVATM